MVYTVSTFGTQLSFIQQEHFELAMTNSMILYYMLTRRNNTSFENHESFKTGRVFNQICPCIYKDHTEYFRYSRLTTIMHALSLHFINKCLIYNLALFWNMKLKIGLLCIIQTFNKQILYSFQFVALFYIPFLDTSTERFLRGFLSRTSFQNGL